MIESENACDEAGDPFAVVPVHVLEGVCGIARQAPRQQTELYRLVLPQEAVVYADGGVLLHCPPRTGRHPAVIYQHLEMGRVA